MVTDTQKISKKIYEKDGFLEMTVEEVLEKYEPLIINMANGYYQKYSEYYEFLELKQIAMIGVWEAYKRYDERRQVGFGHYLSFCLNKKLLLFCRTEKNIVVIPGHVIWNMDKYIKDGVLNLGLYNIDSLDVSANEDDTTVIKEFIPDTKNYEESITTKLVIEQVLSGMTASVKRVVKPIFEDDITAAEVARKVNVSKNYVAMMRRKCYKEIAKALKE